MAEDRDAACARYAELRAHRCVSRTGGWSSHRSKDPVICCKRRGISDAVCRDVLEPLTGLRIDYAEVRDPIELQRRQKVDPTSRLFLAAFLGKTRLIDNGAVGDAG